MTRIRSAITDDNRRPKDRHRQLGFEFLNLQLGEILGLFVIVSKARSVFELRLQNSTIALPRDIACRNIIVSAQVRQRTAKGVHIPSAFKIDPVSSLLVDGKIVRRGKMKYRSRLFADRLKIVFRNSEVRLCDVPFNKREILERCSGLFCDPLDRIRRLLDELGLDEQKELCVVTCEPFYQTLGDKAGKAREENCLVKTH